MLIAFNCASCGKRLKQKEEMAGQKVRCPECGGVMRVPEKVLEAEELPPAVEPADEGYGMAPVEPIKKKRNENRAPCPMCGEMILVDAVKCRFCGEIFDETLKRTEKKRGGYSRDSDLSAGEWVIAILCSGIGCIVGVVWLIQGNPKGGKMLGVSLASAFVWFMIRIALAALTHN